MYEYGKGVDRDPVKAVEWYRKAAELGLVTAQLELGDLYRIGEGVQQDYFEAAKWFRRAAEQGHPIGENTIGYMYCRGEGVSRDYRHGAEWLQKAADQNNALAQSNLGVLYQNGLGVPLSYPEAYKWFTLAANSKATSRRALQEITEIMTKAQLARARPGPQSGWHTTATSSSQARTLRRRSWIAMQPHNHSWATERLLLQFASS
jgi:TPR repeat protein